MYNYWNYPKSLLVALGRKIKGRLDPRYKVFRSKFNSNNLDSKIKFVLVKKGFQLINTIVAYRIYWKDGSISRWFVPGVNDSEVQNLLGNTYTGEAIILV